MRRFLSVVVLAWAFTAAAETKTFEVSAHQFDYTITPFPFVVNQGDTVVINLKATDNGLGSGHGFFLERYSPQNNFVTTSKPVTITFVADKAGSFNFACTRICGGGHSDMGGVFAVNAVQPQTPSITSFDPQSGPAAGGNSVIIDGSTFVTGATVQFGSVAAASTTVSSPTRIVAVAPPHAPGPVAIRVTNPGGETTTSTALYTFEALAVASVTPPSGTTAGGTEITITGTGFVAGATVTIGGVAAREVSVLSATSIHALTPLGPANISANSPRDVVVTNPDAGSATLVNGFTWLLPAPSITSITPAGGNRAGGTVVTITGAGFSSAAGFVVTFGGALATDVQVIDAVTLTARTPAHADGRVDVTITGSNGTATATNAFAFGSGKRRSARH